jgi:hypothetical protein
MHCAVLCYAHMQGGEKLLECGATCTAAIVHGRHVCLANVGDSVAVLGHTVAQDGRVCGQDGLRAEVVTVTHNGRLPAEAERIRTMYEGKTVVLSVRVLDSLLRCRERGFTVSNPQVTYSSWSVQVLIESDTAPCLLLLAVVWLIIMHVQGSGPCVCVGVGRAGGVGGGADALDRVCQLLIRTAPGKHPSSRIQQQRASQCACTAVDDQAATCMLI